MSSKYSLEGVEIRKSWIPPTKLYPRDGCSGPQVTVTISSSLCILMAVFSTEQNSGITFWQTDRLSVSGDHVSCLDSLYSTVYTLDSLWTGRRVRRDWPMAQPRVLCPDTASYTTYKHGAAAAVTQPHFFEFNLLFFPGGLLSPNCSVYFRKQTNEHCVFLASAPVSPAAIFQAVKTITGPTLNSD